MPKHDALSKFEEPKPAIVQNDDLWSLTVIFDNCTRECVNSDHTIDEFGRFIESLIAQNSSLDREGFVAVCIVATSDVKQLIQRREIHDWLPGIGRRLKPILKLSIKTLKDTPNSTVKHIVDIDGIKIWASAFFDLNLAQIQHRIHTYFVNVNLLVKKPVVEKPAPEPSAVAPRAQIKELFLNLPDGYEERAAALTDIDREIHHEMSIQLESAIKIAMLQKPHGNYVEKKEFSKWLNGELRRYGLAIRCKVENDSNIEYYPGIMVVDSGRHPQEGRFRLQCRNNEGKRVITLSTTNIEKIIEHIEICEDDPNRRAWGKWVNRVVQDNKVTSPEV